MVAGVIAHNETTGGLEVPLHLIEVWKWILGESRLDASKDRIVFDLTGDERLSLLRTSQFEQHFEGVFRVLIGHCTRHVISQ